MTCCVLALLALPLCTLLVLCVQAGRSTPETDLGPLPFLVAVGLGAALFTTAACLTGRYPPVPPRARRPASNGSPGSKETSHDE